MTTMGNTTTKTGSAAVRLGELDTLRDLAARLAEAPHGKRGELVDEVAGLLCCSRQQVYRKMADQLGWSGGRKRRKDAGKIMTDEELAVKAAHLRHVATRAHGKRTLPLSDIREMLAESGEGWTNPETGEVIMPSVTTLSRAMRAYGCHPDMLDAKPHTHMKSLHPNWCWQVDPSLCVLFYLPKTGMQCMEKEKFYKNKISNFAKIENERVWRYVITDHYSGTIYVRYVQAPGESAQGLVDVFVDAISERGLNDPMHGVPHMLYMDKGSANTAHLFINLLNRLGVKWDVHKAGNPRAKGSVEVANNIVETKFEGRLKFENVRSLEELQELAARWRLHFNARAPHGRTGKARNDIWMTIREDQLIKAPARELCRELVTTKPTDATVQDDLSITHSIKGFGRNTYDLKWVNGVLPGIKVKVVVNPYRAPAVDVLMHEPLTGEETVWTVEPVEKDEAGFWKDAAVIGQEYKALPETKAETMLKRIEEAAGPDPKAPRAPERVDVMADIKPAPEYMPRRGRGLDLDASRREIAPLTVAEAVGRLKSELGQAPEGAYAWLKQRYPRRVPVADMDKIIERFTNTEPKTTTALLRVVGGEQ
jgi:transposase InsO family protein